jgi:hypothetical protein
MSTAEGGGNIINDNLTIIYDAANPKSFILGSTKWNDLSKFDYDGDLTNSPGYNSNNYGSLTFDGVNQYISIPKTGILTSKSAFTINCWVYPTSLTGIRPIFVNYYVGNLEVLFRFNGSNLQFVTFTSSQVGGTTQAFTAINQWSNVVASYDGTTMKTYVNGVQSPTTFSQSGGLSTSTLPYLIGYYTSPTNYYFEGRIAYCGLYLRTLTDSEILQNYNATKSRFGL